MFSEDTSLMLAKSGTEFWFRNSRSSIDSIMAVLSVSENVPFDVCWPRATATRTRRIRILQTTLISFQKTQRLRVVGPHQCLMTTAFPEIQHQGATRTPRQPERVIACCAKPDVLISSMNSLM